MYEIRVKGGFDAAHFLRDYEGPCASVHGHTWEVEIALLGENLNEAQLLVDFHDLKKILDKKLQRFDHCCLNDISPFDKFSPTSENIARVIYEQVRSELEDVAPRARLIWVRVSESPFTAAIYYPDNEVN